MRDLAAGMKRKGEIFWKSSRKKMQKLNVVLDMWVVEEEGLAYDC